MMILPRTPPSHEQLCRRWHEATVRNHLLTWRAVSGWLAAESLINLVDGLLEDADDMRALSDLARQHYLDLLPSEHDMEAAA